MKALGSSMDATVDDTLLDDLDIDFPTAEELELDEMLVSLENESGYDMWDYDQPPHVKLVNLVLQSAVKDHASDLYFYQDADLFSIKYKVDGRVFEKDPPPRQLFDPMTEHLLTMFGWTQEREKPQTWWQRFRNKPIQMETVVRTDCIYDQILSRRLSYKVNANLNTLPSHEGLALHLELFYPDDLVGVEDLKIPNKGLVLISSLPDHGKTTLGYQMLWSKTHSGETPLCATVEQKHTYNISGAIQVRQRPTDKNYKATLRSLRRFSPELVFFDDVTNLETAQEAIHYASNGSLVIMAVPAKDAPASLEYAQRLGVDKEALAGCLESVVHQTLIPKLHDKCKKEFGKGHIAQTCDDCKEGYKGRVTVHQVGKDISITQDKIEMKYSDLKSCIKEKMDEGVISVQYLNEESSDEDKS